jgi:nitrite reductase/ring-hydroxylating ferredoxin subunit
VRVRVTELEVLRRNGGMKRARHPNDNEWSALILLEGDDVVAIRNACPHYGVDLISGYRNHGWIECPWHGWRIDIRTGQCLHLEREKVDTFTITIDEAGVVFVDLPDDVPMRTYPTEDK